MINNESIPKKNPEYLNRKIGDEIIFISEDGSSLHSIEDCGTFIFENIDGTKTIQEISKKVCETYNIDIQTALNDTLEFIEDLMNKKILFLDKQ